MIHQRLDNWVQVPFHHKRQVIKCEFDAMISDSVLREVVSPDAFIALTGSYLRLSLSGILCVFFGNLPLQQTRTQDGESARLVFLLGPLIRAPDDQTARLVNDL